MGIATREPEYVTCGTADFSDQTVRIGIGVAGWLNALPRPLRLEGRITSGWSLVRPLLAEVEWDEDGSCIVSDNSFLVFGTGESLAAARSDYLDSLIEYYRLLASHDDQPTQALFHELRTYLTPDE